MVVSNDRCFHDCCRCLFHCLVLSLSLREVAKYYWKEVVPMMQEINKALRGYMAVTLLSGVEERLFCYAETRALHGGVIGERPASLRQDDLPWRNEVYYAMGRMSREQGFPDPCPMHTEYLECVVSRRRRPSRRRRSSSFVVARRRRAAPRRAASRASLRRTRLSGRSRVHTQRVTRRKSSSRRRPLTRHTLAPLPPLLDD
jgi:hypothetical protein